jgi:hypothetical protein
VTATESPSALLLRAADRLDGLLAAMGDNRGPWYIANEASHPYPQSIRNIGVPYVVADTFTDPSHTPDTARYICAMHPGTGRDFAAMLRAAAAMAEGMPEAADVSVIRTALSAARNVLKEAS